MSRWQAVVFDLDDTLYPERDYVSSGFWAVAVWAEKHLRIPAGQGYAELMNLFESGVRGDTFDRWLAVHQLVQDSLVPRFVQVYREHRPVLTPFPAVKPMLTTLRQRCRLGVVSDGYLAVQQRKLAALNLHHFFDAIVFSDEGGRKCWKPSIWPFQVVLQRLNAQASCVVYVADNPVKDFLGARQVGMSTVRVRRPGGEYAHLSPPTDRHAADLTVDTLEGLEQAMTELELMA